MLKQITAEEFLADVGNNKPSAEEFLKDLTSSTVPSIKPTIMDKIVQGVQSIPRPFGQQFPQSMATTQRQPKKFIQELDPFTRQPLKLLQKKGEQVQKEASEILGKATGFPKTSEFLTKTFELTPENLTMAIGTEITPLAVSRVLGRFPKSIANRMFGRNAPKDIGMGRLVKGEPPVGTQVLTDPKLEALRINDKNEIFNRATAGIQELRSKIQSVIDKTFRKGITPNIPEVPIKGIPQLEYNPAQVQEIGQTSTIFPKGGEKINIPESITQEAEGKIYQTQVPGAGRYIDFKGRTMTPSTRANVSQKEMIKNIKEFNRLKSEGFHFLGLKKEPAINTKDIANSIDGLIEEVKSSFGTNSPQLKRLINFKQNFLSGKPEFLDFRTANGLRESLGASIGKRFNIEPSLSGLETPETLQAQKIIFAKLRNMIGKISPELDELLKDQHILLEVRRSVAPEAARGYGSVPLTVSHAVTLPLSTNMRFANFLENVIPGISGKGIGAGLGASIGATENSLSKEIRGR